MRYAIIRKGVVVNVTEGEPKPAPDYIFVQSDTARPGDFYVGGEFVASRATETPEPAPEDRDTPFLDLLVENARLTIEIADSLKIPAEKLKAMVDGR